MLGKQGWKLLSDPNALISHIYKARCYPRGDFLKASLGNNPSFTWRSIWSSRVLLEGGCRWKIGDGRNIRVWGDSWLKDEGNFRVVTPLQDDLVDTYVHDLMIPNCKEWDKDLIEDMFVERDARAICDIFLSSIWSQECLLWHFNKNRHYSV